jgi:hypothetical protein
MRIKNSFLPPYKSNIFYLLVPKKTAHAVIAPSFLVQSLCAGFCKTLRGSEALARFFNRLIEGFSFYLKPP